jgi:hypothetical protein
VERYVREDEFAAAVQMGRDNAEMIDLIRHHCSHARVVMPFGNSTVGQAYGLPMGSLEIRCEHAPPPRTSGHALRELAIEFYRANCVGCPHRNPSGILRNLAAVVAEEDREEARRQEAAEQAAQQRARRFEQRRERRRVMVAGQGHVARDLAEWLDRLDGPSPRPSEGAGMDREAARQLAESARHAPDLFTDALVESMLEMAVDTAEPTVFTALMELARAGRCRPRSVMEAALAVLPSQRLPEAGQTLALFGDVLHPDDLPPILDALTQMAAGRDAPWYQLPPAPEGLLAAAAVDLTAVTAHLIERLASDDEWQRADAAKAARLLLAADPGRVIALGPAVVRSIRGQDQGYAGEPHPAAAAVGALAEAWRGEPDTTVRAIESGARDLPSDARVALVGTVSFLRRWREPLQVSDDAARTAVAFCFHRLSGDWGEDAADRAGILVEELAGEIPEHLVSHVDALISQVLSLCAAGVPSLLETGAGAGAPAAIAALERENRQILRHARRRRVAHAVGELARHDPKSVLTRVLTLFDARSGDHAQDRRVRVTLLEALGKAAGAGLLRDLLPVLYTALLGDDQAVRAAAIRLWAACAGIAGGELPEEFAELAEPMLNDRYVVVHKAILDHLPQLGLPARLAPALLPAVAAWAGTYANDSDVLNDVLEALRFLASMLDDERQALAWDSAALAMVDRLRPHDRERMLCSGWPPPLRAHPAWSRAALGTLASPEMADYFNYRHEPLLTGLLDQPGPLAEVPFEEVAAISDLHLPRFVWRALEPIELLQSAGRWNDAHVLASRVADAMPPGKEGASGRALAQFAQAVAKLSEAASKRSAMDSGEITALARAVQDAAAALTSEWRLSDDREDQSGRQLVESGTAQADAVLALLAPITTSPADTAATLDGAARRLETAAGTEHASAVQRRWLAAGWKIAAIVCRYDGAIRAADADAHRFLLAAQRQARVLAASVDADPEIPAPEGLTQFCAQVLELTAADGLPHTVNAILATAGAPLHLVNLPDWPPAPPILETPPPPEELPVAVCVASTAGSPITDTLVVRPGEAYIIEMSIRIPRWPAWADHCHVQPVSALGRAALTLPEFTFSTKDGATDEAGILLSGQQPLHCAVEQPIQSPPIDCPLMVRFTGGGREQFAEVAGYRRLRLRPFDPSRDHLTEHEQTDARLLAMYDTLTDAAFDTEDVRAFCRLFSACVRAGQAIMFEKTFRRGTRVTEKMFHDELEKHLRADPELDGRLTRRDAVAGGFDDLLHDDVIAELKVERDKPVTVDDCAKYLGQPTQYGAGRGSQLSALVVLDHSRKQAPPGVIENYVGWLKPRLHGLDDPRYPSLVGVLIINTNLPVPSTWSRKAIVTEPVS